VRSGPALLDRLPAIALLVAMASYHTVVNLARLACYEPVEWDLAIFGQGVWLLSRGEAPNVTVRGLNLLGEHATFVHAPIALVYRLLGPLADVRLLILLQSLALGWAGWRLHAIALGRLGRASALLVLSAYLLYPPLAYTWRELYQPVALALAPLLLAFENIREGRSRPALAWALAALLCMENVAATVAAMGVYALFLGRRRLGLALAVGSAVYVAILLNLWFPWLNPGVGYVYGYRLFGDFASSLPEALAYLTNPVHLLTRIATAQNAEYLAGLLLPVGFVPLAAPAALVMAAQLPLNLVSSWPYAHEIRYHYVALVIPFVFLSVIACLGRYPTGSLGRRRLGGLVLAGALAGQVLYAPPWLAGRGDPGRSRDLDALLGLIPPTLSISTDHAFLPHLCERRQLFMFPDLGTPEADAVLLDLQATRRFPAETARLRSLPDLGFREAFRSPGDVVLYVRGPSPWLVDAAPR
jgi:uncharacterized membrane protein